MEKAFTLLELTFVIVIIGILSAVAIPRFAATRDDALVARGMSTLAAVRSAIASERQKRILRGDYTAITNLSNGASGRIFTKFNDDGNGKANGILDYGLKSGTNPGQWSKSSTTYTFYYQGGSCAFALTSNRLTGTCTAFGD